MSRRARRWADARPWDAQAPDDDERAELDRILGELPGDDESTHAHDLREHDQVAEHNRSITQ